MAYFSRLIAFLLITFSASSYALTVESDPSWMVPSYAVKSTPEEACQAHDTARGLIFDSVASDTPRTRKCMSRWPGDTTSTWRNTAEMVCDTSQGSLNTSKLKCVKTVTVCPAGMVDVGGVCTPEPCPSAGHKEGDGGNAWETTSKVPANNLCIQGCSWSAGGTVPSVCANGKCYYFGPFTSNGSSCTGQDGASGDPDVDPPEETPPDDAQCVAKGQCPGTINGTKVCVPCSSKEGTTSESGSSSGTGTDSSGNPTGDTGTTNTTKETTANCTNGSCNTTTTTTVTNPDGSTTTTTETESKPQADFCKANPGHIVCKGEDEGTFGGSCAAGFQCSGDAVQCAQAEAAWKSVCALDVSGMTDQVNDGTAAMAAGAASGLGIPGGSDAFDLGSRLSEVPLFGSSGGCPSDVSVNVGGTSYTIAFSSMCPQLQVLGVALMAFAYLVAGFIVFRGDRS